MEEIWGLISLITINSPDLPADLKMDRTYLVAVPQAVVFGCQKRQGMGDVKKNELSLALDSTFRLRRYL